MLLFAIFLISLSSQAVAHIHLCERLQQGNFSAIELKSFTFYARNVLVLFAGTGDASPFRKYYISDIKPDHVMLPESHSLYSDHELTKPIATLNFPADVTIQAVHMLDLVNPKDRIDWDATLKSGHYETRFKFLLVIANHRMQLWSEGKNIQPIDWPFTLVHDSTGRWGAQLTKLENDDSKETIMIQNFRFDDDYDRWESFISEYFFLSIPNDHQLQFDKMKTLTSTAAIFTGYILGSRMYLFDSVNGCVYILTDWDENSLRQAGPIVKNRINVPYEQFFRCPAKWPAKADLNGSRCGKIGSSSRDSSTHAIGDEKRDNFLNWIGLGGVVALALIVLVVIFYMRSKRAKESKSKSRTAVSSRKRAAISKRKKLIAKSKDSGAGLISQTITPLQPTSFSSFTSQPPDKNPLLKKSPSKKDGRGESTASIKTDATKTTTSKSKSTAVGSSSKKDASSNK